MRERRIKKRLIEPKVRLLLWIHLHGVGHESNYLAKLADKIDYSEGSIKSHLIPDLLERNLIESLHPDKVSPPYRTTSEANEFLAPIFLVRIIGYAFAVFVFVMLVALFGYYINEPALLFQWWLPLFMIGFSVLVFALIIYPNMLLKLGKIASPRSK